MMDKKKINKLVVILGPTASGKTDLAIDLATELNGEIVSADSRQVYKGMDIATAKEQGKSAIIDGESCRIIQGIPHYLIDILEPDEEYSLAQYQADAFRIIDKINLRGKVAFLVGGTGLYIQAVCENLAIPRVAPDFNLRKSIEQEINQRGLETVFANLAIKCPRLAKSIDSQNPRRVIRAIEICQKSGDLEKLKNIPRYDCIKIGLKVDRDKLYERINVRVDKMVSKGLEEEAKWLSGKYSPDIPSMSGIGYAEMFAYFAGQLSLTQAIVEIKKNTRHYARRQISWFGRFKDIKWMANYNLVFDNIKKFLKI